MNEGIAVSYQENGWLKHFFRIVGILALMGGLALAALAPDGVAAGMIVTGIAVALIVVNEIRFARLKAAERSVIDTGSGFRWLGDATDTEVQDSQVVAVRIKRTSKYSAGIPKGIIRRYEVWTADSDEPMCMTNRLAVNGSDPLADLIARQIEDLKQRTAAGLADGATLEGEGWNLAAMQLSILRGRSFKSLPFMDIDKVAVFDGKICLWRRGQDEPAAKISPDSKNASVLASLLGEWIEHQREASGELPATVASGLGRLLFERSRSEGLWLGLILAAVCGSLGPFLLLHRHHRPLGLILLAAAAVSLLLSLFFGRYVFRCYELGLIRRRGGSAFMLLYDEIMAFTYASSRIFVKGAYAGTQVSLIFRAPRGTIRFATRVQNNDADLDGLRDQIAKTIASRMLCELRAGGAVPWTADIVFLPQGLQFRRSKMLGLASGPIEMLPYQQIRSVDLRDGAFHLYSKAEGKPLISKPVGSANFFPGYFVVLTLQEQAGNGEAAIATGNSRAWV